MPEGIQVRGVRRSSISPLKGIRQRFVCVLLHVVKLIVKTVPDKQESINHAYQGSDARDDCLRPCNPCRALRCFISQQQSLEFWIIRHRFAMGGRMCREHEPGIGGAMVVLDNGSYILTDEYGRYHFPAVVPGHRLLKINLRHLADNATSTTEETEVVSVTPGLLAKANFGVRFELESKTIGRPATKGVVLKSHGKEKPVQVQGNVEMLLAVVNGTLSDLPNAEIQLGVEALEEMIELRQSANCPMVEADVNASKHRAEQNVKGDERA